VEGKSVYIGGGYIIKKKKYLNNKR